jgi:ABC-type multidrug transport system fused ATPase/permease subunit
VRLDKFLRRRELEQLPNEAADGFHLLERTDVDSKECEEGIVLQIVDGEFEWEAKTEDDDDDDDADESEESEEQETENNEKTKNEDGAERAAKGSFGVEPIGEEDASLLQNDMEMQPLEAASGQVSGFQLRDINVEVKRGELVAIIGRVGSGKTSLLNCMLGEMKHKSGRIRRNMPAISYVSQRYRSSPPPLNDEMLDLNVFII